MEHLQQDYTIVPIPHKTRFPKSPEDWDEHKQEIGELYAVKELKVVMKYMEDTYSFKATRKQWTTQLKKWNFKKRNEQADYLAILKKKRQREQERPGVSSHFTLQGKEVPSSKIARWEKRARKGGKLAEEDTLSEVATPAGLLCMTPRAGDFLATSDDQDVSVACAENQPALPTTNLSLSANLSITDGLLIACKPLPKPISLSPSGLCRYMSHGVVSTGHSLLIKFDQDSLVEVASLLPILSATRCGSSAIGHPMCLTTIPIPDRIVQLLQDLMKIISNYQGQHVSARGREYAMVLNHFYTTPLIPTKVTLIDIWSLWPVCEHYPVTCTNPELSVLESTFERPHVTDVNTSIFCPHSLTFQGDLWQDGKYGAFEWFLLEHLMRTTAREYRTQKSLAESYLMCRI